MTALGGVTTAEVHEAVTKGSGPYRQAAENEDYKRGYGVAAGEWREMHEKKSDSYVEQIRTLSRAAGKARRRLVLVAAVMFAASGFSIAAAYEWGQLHAREIVREVRVEVKAVACYDQVVLRLDSEKTIECPHPDQVGWMFDEYRLVCNCPHAASAKP